MILLIILIINSFNIFQILATLSLKKNKLFQLMPKLEQQWYLSFDIKPKGTVSEWGNIVHATTDGKGGQYGFRIPAIWFRPDNLKMLFCYSINGDGKAHRCFEAPDALSTTDFTNVRVSQTWNSTHYVFQISVNGDVKFSKVNFSPDVFENVKVYASNPWDPAANADVKNLVFKNIPSGRSSSFFL